MLTNFDGDLEDSLNEEGYRKSMSMILGQISHIFPETDYISLCAYTQSKMRDHYNNCITNKNFEAYPYDLLKKSI